MSEERVSLTSIEHGDILICRDCGFVQGRLDASFSSIYSCFCRDSGGNHVHGPERWLLADDVVKAADQRGVPYETVFMTIHRANRKQRGECQEDVLKLLQRIYKKKARGARKRRCKKK